MQLACQLFKPPKINVFSCVFIVCYRFQIVCYPKYVLCVIKQHACNTYLFENRLVFSCLAICIYKEPDYQPGDILEYVEE